MPTNCANFSRTLQGTLFETTPDLPPGAIRVVIPGRLPSWNEILGMEHWARAKFKSDIQDAFLSELRRSAADSSTKTTCARSIMSIAAATLESYQATQRAKRASRQAKKRSEAKLKSALKS
jgi:hypothetical protein